MASRINWFSIVQIILMGLVSLVLLWCILFIADIPKIKDAKDALKKAESSGQEAVIERAQQKYDEKMDSIVEKGLERAKFELIMTTPVLLIFCVSHAIEDKG